MLALEGSCDRRRSRWRRRLTRRGPRAEAEARREWEEELEAKIENERAWCCEACEEFRRERARYFAGVEAEVVKLALAIAARVLHREAQWIHCCFRALCGLRSRR